MLLVSITSPECSSFTLIKLNGVSSVYSKTCLFAVPRTNTLVPSLLKLTAFGALSWLLTSKAPTKDAVETSNPKVKSYSLMSFP